MSLSMTFLPLLIAAFLLGACQRDASSPRGPDGLAQGACKPGHKRIDSASACLMDDAECYRIESGDWCTGASASGGDW